MAKKQINQLPNNIEPIDLDTSYIPVDQYEPSTNSYKTVRVSGEIFKTDLSDYYDKSEIDTMIDDLSGDIVIDETVIKLGTNGGLFFNDNGIFEEMAGIKFDNDEGMFYNENYDGGLKMSEIEIPYGGSTLTLPYVGIYGFPDSNNKPYFNGFVDGSLYGMGKSCIS